METMNFGKLAKQAIGLASGVVLAGTAVMLPASAQVETAPASGETTLEAPSVEDAPTPEVPAVEEEVPAADELTPVESLEPSTDKPTAETLTPETETTEEAVSPETEEVAPETTEASETEVEEVAPETTEASETETETEATEASETETEATPAETTEVPSEAPGVAVGSGTIVDVAAASDTFQTLVSALNEAELAEVLQGEGPFTVFAPTDEAFAALPEGTVEELLKPENRDTLVKILSYHVVPGSLTSDQLTSGEVATVEGSPVTVTVQDSAVTVNDASVIQPDIPASNGVIHAIDRVILPPDLQ